MVLITKHSQMLVNEHNLTHEIYSNMTNPAKYWRTCLIICVTSGCPSAPTHILLTLTWERPVTDPVIPFTENPLSSIFLLYFTILGTPDSSSIDAVGNSPYLQLYVYRSLSRQLYDCKNQQNKSPGRVPMRSGPQLHGLLHQVVPRHP